MIRVPVNTKSNKSLSEGTQSVLYVSESESGNPSKVIRNNVHTRRILKVCIHVPAYGESTRMLSVP